MIILPPSAVKRSTTDRRSVQQAAAEVGMALPDVAVLALQQGRVIEAIKLIRTANPGLDLARAKAAMERLRASTEASRDVAEDDAMPIAAPRPGLSAARPPTVAMGDPPGQLRWLLVVVVLLVAATWLAFGGA